MCNLVDLSVFSFKKLCQVLNIMLYYARAKQTLMLEESSRKIVSERKEGMRTTVDPDLCIGCGICEGIVPEVFILLNEPYAEVLLDPVPEEFHEAVREAAEECPEMAIAIIE